MSCNVICRTVSAICQKQCGEKAEYGSHLYALYCIVAIPLLEQIPAAYSYYHDTGKHECTCGGMEKLVHRNRREDYLRKVNHLVPGGIGIELHSDGILHPCVCNKNPDCREVGPYGSKPCRGQMEPFADFVPPEVHDGKKGTLHKKCKYTLDCQRRTEYVAYKPGVVAPVCSELELQNYACGHAHGKVDCKDAGPESGEFFPEQGLLLIFRPLLFRIEIISGLHEGYDKAKSKSEGDKYPMEHCRQGELQPRGIN